MTGAALGEELWAAVVEGGPDRATAGARLPAQDDVLWGSG